MVTHSPELAARYPRRIVRLLDGQVASGVVRRRVQSAVLFVVVLAASAAATLGLARYTSANEAFQENFTTYHGAQLAVRERVHDLGVAKAIGMTPRQTVTMVLLWAVAPAVGAAVVGIGAPSALVRVYRTGQLALLALAGLALAAFGSLGPAVWAAVSRTTDVLRTE